MMSPLNDNHFTVVGAGNIGRILLERLAAAGVPVDHLAVCDSDPARGQAAADRQGVRSIPLADDTACTADAILIASPPPTVADVLRAIAGRLHPGQVVISFAAAVPLSPLEALVPPGVSVARIMPTAPSLVGQGMNPVAYGASATPEARALVEAILAILGETVEVQDGQMAWCVGLAGAAMRSVLPVLEGMTQAGVEAGLSPEAARRVAAQAMLGTAALALQTDLSFDQIKSLTPMQTVDEAAVAELFRAAARQARDKIDQLQHKLEGAS
jgi:pyrroline-5-carboxylate reductase